jgi:cell wall-associated NlpC family hydrolase
MSLSTFTIPITSEQRDTIRRLSEEAFPREACGFICADGTISACQNHSIIPDQFIISAEDYDDNALAVWHSHANYAKFSQADIKACKQLGLPFVMWDCGSSQLFYLNPSQQAGLMERPWNYGVYDCYGAVRDWYYQQFGWQLGDYERQYEGEWSTHGFTHFEDNFSAEGFLPLPPDMPLQRGDAILFRIRNQTTSNHVAVIEDVSANMLFQQLVGRLSGLSLYSSYFRENTSKILRRPV